MDRSAMLKLISDAVDVTREAWRRVEASDAPADMHRAAFQAYMAAMDSFLTYTSNDDVTVAWKRTL